MIYGVLNGNYFYGDNLPNGAIETPERPDHLHIWQNGKWVYSPEIKTQFTSLEFLAKFTQSEQLAVVAATLQSPVLKLWYDMMLAASFVDLTDQRTIDGLTALVGAGLLTQQRKTEILA